MSSEEKLVYTFVDGQTVEVITSQVSTRSGNKWSSVDVTALKTGADELKSKRTSAYKIDENGFYTQLENRTDYFFNGKKIKQEAFEKTGLQRFYGIY